MTKKCSFELLGEGICGKPAPHRYKLRKGIFLCEKHYKAVCAFNPKASGYYEVIR